MQMTLLAVHNGESALAQGVCDFTIQTASSRCSSPFDPKNWRIEDMLNLTSPPVATPVSISRYWRMNVLPDLWIDVKHTLFPSIGSLSKNLISLSKIHLFSAHKPSSEERSKLINYFKLTVLVSLPGITSFDSVTSYPGNILVNLCEHSSKPSYSESVKFT